MDTRISTLDERILAAQEVVDALDEERRALALELVRKDHPEAGRLELGEAWECETSPTGLCVYDDEADRCHDECLYCGGPEERK